MSIDEYSFDVLRSVMLAALEQLVKEPKLFSFRINERTLTQRLSLHLQPLFPQELSVDCEYNRMWEDDADLVKKLPWGAEQVWSNDDEGRTVYPDIIVHVRGGRFENLLVIEAKRNLKEGTMPEIDERKLERFTHPAGDFRYRWGAFINFVTHGEDRKAIVIWFSESRYIGKNDCVRIP